MLPWNGNGARIELGIEGGIVGVDVDALDGGELLDIQHVLGVHGVRLTLDGIERKEANGNGLTSTIRTPEPGKKKKEQ